MDVLTSAEFRKAYAKLSKETLVTVNGHAIGRWVPLGYNHEYAIGGTPVVSRQGSPDTFGHSRPAPKPGRK